MSGADPDARLRVGLLVVDSIDEPHRKIAGDYFDLFENLLAPHGVCLVPYDAHALDLPDTHECEGWIVPGSRQSVYDDLDWIPQLSRWVLDAIEREVPLVGVCFGHQLIARALGARVEKSTRGWWLNQLARPAGNPFQLEVAFANLALGVLGILAVGRRDGMREATVIAVTIFSLGATVVHLMDIAATGNLAPGNSLQNVINILRPVLLIAALIASRRAERTPGSEAGTLAFDQWREPRGAAAGVLTAVVATGFGLGFAIQQPFLGSALGVVVGVALVARIISRAPAKGEAI